MTKQLFCCKNISSPEFGNFTSSRHLSQKFGKLFTENQVRAAFWLVSEKTAVRQNSSITHVNVYCGDYRGNNAFFTFSTWD